MQLYVQHHASSLYIQANISIPHLAQYSFIQRINDFLKKSTSPSVAELVEAKTSVN